MKMGFLSIFLILYLGGIACIANDCNKCECCKNGINRCIDNGFETVCVDGCIDGYYGPSCTHACKESCLSCSNDTYCQKCKPGFYIGTYQDSLSTQYNDCRYKCPSDCFSCTSYQCINGKYGANCDKTCLENCVKCISGATCGKCSPGYWGDRCMACPLHCSSCTSYNFCLKCDPGYYGNLCVSNCSENCLNHACNKINGTCNSCIDGFYGHDCEKECPKNCASNKCKPDGKCFACLKGFYGDTCTKICSKNCKKCHSVGICQSCKDGFYGLECQHLCPSGCKICEKSEGHCIRCKFGFSNKRLGICEIKSKCETNCKTCKNRHNACDTCKDGKYGQLSNSTYPHCRFSCPVQCLNNSCDVKTGHCLYGCKTGYWVKECKTPCSEKCYERKCSDNTVNCTTGARCSCPDNCECDSQGKCKVSGNDKSLISVYNVTQNCENCPENCKDNICDFVNGNCTRGCNLGYWGYKCEQNCKNGCMKCVQHTGRCMMCENKNFAEDCSKSCSTHCIFSNSSRICDTHDGTCLNGCDTLTRYGKHCENKCTCLNNSCNWETGNCLTGCKDNFYGNKCETACSVTCLRIAEKNVCNLVNGHCILECKDGFHGDRCDRNCSINCLTIKCDRDTGNCSGVCRDGYTGPKCDEPQSRTSTSMTSVVIIVACFGAPPLMIIILMYAICRIRKWSRVKKTRNEEMIEVDTINNFVSVVYSENVPVVSEVDLSVTEYAKPIKAKRSVQESEFSEDKENSSSSRYQKPKHTIVYENSGVRGYRGLNFGDRSRVYVEPNKGLEETEIMKENEMIFENDDACTQEMEFENTYYNVMVGKQSRIKLDQFAVVVSKKTKDDFIEEFKGLPQGLIKPYTQSQKKCNLLKNRYKGVYPYDDTRVVLKDGDSDYINANFIDGHTKKKAYIASLGPTYQYMGDMSAFWRMVWQEKVGKIVMLTKLKEAGAPKCDQYWPEKDKRNLYAKIEVACKAEKIYAEYTVRNFTIRKGSETRSIVLLHFTAWPDKRIPDDVTSMVEFRQKVYSTKTMLEGPILVHCSAGVGRTGTYIALDILTIEGESEGGVDIYECVRNMREQRVHMVQTVDVYIRTVLKVSSENKAVAMFMMNNSKREQYRFLYDAVVHTLTLDCKPVEAIQFSDYMNTYTENDLSEQFEKIQKSAKSRTEDEIEAVKRNKLLRLKNRLGADIPGDRNRPKLRLVRGFDTSDYINAVYVNSYKTVNRYLVAQSPIPGTVDDFLTLVMQENVSCVIDMEPDESNKNVGVYYSDYGTTIETDMFVVTTEPGESTDQYIFRKVVIKHRNDSNETTVQHIQVKSWGNMNKIPEPPVKFVEFIRNMELKFFGNEKEGPVLVHCLTGAVKSGLFCAVSILLEKMQIDQEVSVVNTVRQIKQRRHMSIPDKEQFIFCHQCIHEFLHFFETYSNFACNTSIRTFYNARS